MTENTPCTHHIINNSSHTLLLKLGLFDMADYESGVVGHTSLAPGRTYKYVNYLDGHLVQISVGIINSANVDVICFDMPIFADIIQFDDNDKPFFRMPYHVFVSDGHSIDLDKIPKPRLNQPTKHSIKNETSDYLYLEISAYDCLTRIPCAIGWMTMAPNTSYYYLNQYQTSMYQFTIGTFNNNSSISSALFGKNDFPINYSVSFTLNVMCSDMPFFEEEIIFDDTHAPYWKDTEYTID